MHFLHVISSLHFLQSLNYPVNGINKIYEKGINLVIDSFAHTNSKDVTVVRDSERYSGNLEHGDTPVDGLNQPKLLIHNKNEIPLFLGPNKRYLTLENYKYNYGDYVGEVQIPMKVVTFKNFIFIV